MKNFLVLNKTAEPKYALLTGDKAFTDQGPDGSFFNDETQQTGGTRQVISHAPYKEPTKVMKADDMSEMELEGQFLVEIDGVVVPHIFNADDLGLYFTEERGLAIVFEGGSEPWIPGMFSDRVTARHVNGEILEGVSTETGWGVNLLARTGNTYAKIAAPFDGALTLPKGGFENLVASPDGRFILMSERVDPMIREGAETDLGDLSIYDSNSGMFVGLVGADITIHEAVFFGNARKFLAVRDDKTIHICELSLDGTVFNKVTTIQQENGYISGFNVDKYGTQLHLAYAELINDIRHVKLRSFTLGEDGGILDEMTVTGPLLDHSTGGFGGGSVNGDWIDVSGTFLINVDNLIFTVKVDPDAKTAETDQLPIVGNVSNIALIRRPTLSGADFFVMDNDFNYKVYGFDAGTSILQELKAATSLGFRVSMGRGATSTVADNVLVHSAYDPDPAPGTPSSFVRITEFDASNNITILNVAE